MVFAADGLLPTDGGLRSRVYQSLEGKLPFMFASGGISHFHPLRVGSWVVLCKMGKLHLGQVCVIYLKGGGQRATHNQSATCTDISKLSRLVVLKYTSMGDSCWLSPLTASVTSNPTPSVCTYLYAHQPDVVTSLDALCLATRVIKSEAPLQPGLQMLEVIPQLMQNVKTLEDKATEVIKTAEYLVKEARKRNKRKGDDRGDER
ncbi:hypothetical protein LXA43DRAFT_152132 [Ganoderma leucocontextum]|nr:hypothetical protein LXA43DRAFT_152132 [Ganoderma leucocontextum]